jgi:hypothetical protein
MIPIRRWRERSEKLIREYKGIQGTRLGLTLASKTDWRGYPSLILSIYDIYNHRRPMDEWMVDEKRGLPVLSDVESSIITKFNHLLRDQKARLSFTSNLFQAL